MNEVFKQFKKKLAAIIILHYCSTAKKLINDKKVQGRESREQAVFFQEECTSTPLGTLIYTINVVTY